MNFTRSALWRGAVIAALGGGLLLAHYATPTHSHTPHDVYDRLLYIPIVLAAFWFGVAGGLTTSLLVTFAYAPHFLFDLGGDPLGHGLGRTFELWNWNLVALITGWLSQRLRRERDRAEATARERQQALSDLSERTRQVLEAEGQLRHADRLATLGKLAANLAHEIRNPLGSIRGTAEILADHFQPGQREHEFLTILQREVTRLNAVLTNFLEFARGQSLSGFAASGTSTVEEAITTVSHLLEQELAKREVILELRAVSPGLTVPIPAQQLTQLLLNLVLNAAQATPRGGSICITTESRDAQATICVEDSGPGIPAEIREKAFQPFFTTREDGTGLGLSIVQRIAQRAGGRAEVGESRLGGALLRIVLPEC